MKGGIQLTGQSEPLRLDRLRNFQIVSLWDMREFSGNGLVNAINELAYYSVKCEAERESKAAFLPKIKFALEAIHTLCTDIGLDTPAFEAGSILAELNVVTVADLGMKLRHLIATIEHDSKKYHFIAIPPKAKDLLQIATPFGKEVFGAVSPSINSNITEAAKCLALDRSTACVVHLCFAVESALDTLLPQAGLTKNPKGTFGTTAVDLVDKVKKFQDSTISHKQVKDKWAEVASHLESFAVGVRNVAMHNLRDQSYSPTEAEAIYGITKIFFLRYIQLPKPPPIKP